LGRLVWFLAGATAGAVVAALFVLGSMGPELRARSQPDAWRARALEAERQIAALRERIAALESSARSPAEGGAPAAPEPTPLALAPSREQRELAPDERADEWDVLIAGAVDEAAERLGRTPTAEERAELIEALRDVRRAALSLDAEGEALDASGEPGETAWGDRLTRSLVLLEADRRAREVLGVGVPELLSALEEDGYAPVEDLSAPARAADR
jgi:hypothetical protein